MNQPNLKEQKFTPRDLLELIKEQGFQFQRGSWGSDGRNDEEIKAILTIHARIFDACNRGELK
jgi:hypothetical protein